MKRTLHTILLGVGVPLTMVMAGLGVTAPAESAMSVTDQGTSEVFPFPGGIGCAVVLCPSGTICIDKPGSPPQCVPSPYPKPWPGAQ